MTYKTNYEYVDFESAMDFNKEVNSCVSTRFERRNNRNLALRKTTNDPLFLKKINGNGTPGHKRSRSKSSGKAVVDRFVPNRNAMDFDGTYITKENTPGSSKKKNRYSKALAEGLGINGSKRVLSFKSKAPEAAEGYRNNLRVIYSQSKTNTKNVKVKKAKANRNIPCLPDRILDCPEIMDDYYLNLVDWGLNNIVAIALEKSVYLWDAVTGGIEELTTLDDGNGYVSSVNWVKNTGNASTLGIGLSNGSVEIWDAERMSKLRSMKGHTARVGSLDWNNAILSSGSQDTTIIHHDVRIAKHTIATLLGHQQEICGLKWSPDGRTLASGGNDNVVALWDASASDGKGINNSKEIRTPRCTLTDHVGAVRALAWCPFQHNVLASGGGTADRTIKFWNAGNNALLNSIDTGSQVCSLLWNTKDREILSSHGFSKNQLCLWKYPSMKLVKELTGHTARVLQLTPSPDGNQVCSVSADETMRFWNVFGGENRNGPEMRRIENENNIMKGREAKKEKEKKVVKTETNTALKPSANFRMMARMR